MMNMKLESVNRRTFLRASGVALSLPLLEVMNPAFGKTIAASPKRMVFICTALGLHSPALFPKKTGKDYESTEYLDLLNEHHKDLTLFSGLSHPDQGGEHATEMTFLSAARNPGQDGFRNSTSIRQHTALQSLRDDAATHGNRIGFVRIQHGHIELVIADA